MGFKSDKQRKGFFANQGVGNSQSLPQGVNEQIQSKPKGFFFKAKSKLLDVETKIAKKISDAERNKIEKQIAKEKDIQIKQAVLDKKQAELEKVRIDRELEHQKLFAAKEKTLQLREGGKAKALDITLSPQEKELLQAREERLVREREKKKDFIKTAFGGRGTQALIGGLKVVGRAGLSVAQEGIKLAQDQPQPRRRKSKKKTVKSVVVSKAVRRTTKKKTGKRMSKKKSGRRIIIEG